MGRKPLDGNRALYFARFRWTAAPHQGAELRISRMSEHIAARLNKAPAGIRFTYPFHLDLTALLRGGESLIEVEHVERHTFVSKLGRVEIVPYHRTLIEELP
jgi:hypothetical protein